jgi:hypothetical protein
MSAPIFHGVSEVFDEWLGLTGQSCYGTQQGVPKYKSRQAAIDLSDKKGSLTDQPPLNAEQAIQRAMETLGTNIPETDWSPADSNWKWEKSLKIASHNPSQEKTLEKLTAFLLDDSWVNQVPVCNGLVASGRADPCRIDLAHRVAERKYELIELKFGTEGTSGSDHPLFAAMEVVHYGLMYLLFRQRPLQVQRDHHLLQADQITLIVLAPAAWYRFKRRGDSNLYPFDFGWLARLLSDGLQAYSREHGIDLDIRMEFQTLAASFHANYLSLLGGIQAFRDDAFNSRQTLVGAVNL